jgi:mutator protein MutT
MQADSIPVKRIGVAVIQNSEGLILIDRRLSQGYLGGFWEFPGGKIEPDETVEECIRREIKEEIGIEISVDSHLITIEHTYPHFRVCLQVYNCKYLAGEPRPLECEEIRWVSVNELHNYKFPEANFQIIDALQKI